MVLVSPPVMVKSHRNFVQMAWCSTTMQSTKKNATFLSTLTAANGPIYVSNIILMHENTNLVLIGNVIRHAYVYIQRENSNHMEVEIDADAN